MSRRLPAILLALLLVLTACGRSGGGTGARATGTLRLVTHDSFAVEKGTLEAFRAQTGLRVKVVQLGDAGTALNQAILTKANPLGDVFFGVDNTFLTRALDADLFIPYRAAGLAGVPTRFRLDPRNRVTPVDHGEVCVNYDTSRYGAGGGPAPVRFEDLTGPAYRDALVVENPATSSPGLAFLLATVAHFGEGGWQDYWRGLRANGTAVAAGWEEAYNQRFSAGSGKGDRPVVVSYASSPPAEVVYSDPPRTDPGTAVMTSTCFEQIEFAGVIRGGAHPAAARRLVDFMLTQRFQRQLPLQMFVFPVVEGVPLPEVFRRFAADVADPLRVPPDRIAAGRDRWIREWTAIMGG